MQEQFQRTSLTFGVASMERLSKAKVLIFGLGGVGGHVAEALARSGIGSFTLVDSDKVAITNINRQIIATLNTIGRYKVDCMKERILSINPQAKIETYTCFYLPENKDLFHFSEYDYVIDCIDTITAKLSIIEEAYHVGTPIISAMGAGNKINPAMLMVEDISKTSVDPLAKVIRLELKKRGIKKLKVVYSKEKPIKPKEGIELNLNEQDEKKRSIAGSNAFVPSVMGLIIASEVIKDLTNIHNDIQGS